MERLNDDSSYIVYSLITPMGTTEPIIEYRSLESIEEEWRSKGMQVIVLNKGTDNE